MMKIHQSPIIYDILPFIYYLGNDQLEKSFSKLWKNISSEEKKYYQDKASAFLKAAEAAAINVVQENPGLRLTSSKQTAEDPDLLFVPPRGAIANVIISTWLKKYHDL